MKETKSKKTFGRNMKDFGLRIIVTTLAGNAIPYVTPTMIRLSESGQSTKYENVGMAIGSLIGIAGVIGQTIFYYQAFNEGNPIFYIPATLTTTSLIYEIGRKFTKKGKANLEETVSN